MKKGLFLVLVLLFAFVLIGCKEDEVYRIAMVTDAGDIDDRSFNQGTYEGIKAFAEEHNISFEYYRPTEVSFNAYIAAIDLAVENGAEIIVTPGFLFSNSIHKAQQTHPDIKFVLIDAEPHNVNDFATMATYDGEAVAFGVNGPNTLSILFQEEQSSFLAGYGVVREGYTELGFMGGKAVPAVVRFGAGFVAGAYYAAEAMGLTDFEFSSERFTYLETFGPDPTIVTRAGSWFTAGTEVIHVAAGGAGNSVMLAADNAENKWVVGVDVDQRNESDRVITSAMKGLAVAVQDALKDFFIDEDFVGGRVIKVGAEQGAVGLPTDADSWRFSTFTVAQYEAILAKLVDGTVVVPESHTDPAGLKAFIEALGFTFSQELSDAIIPPSS